MDSFSGLIVNHLHITLAQFKQLKVILGHIRWKYAKYFINLEHSLLNKHELDFFPSGIVKYLCIVLTA